MTKLATIIDVVTCSKCGKCSPIENANDHFQRHRKEYPENWKSSWISHCKVCILENKREYYKRKSDLIRSYKKAYYRRNDGQIKSRENYQRNKENILKRNSERRLRNSLDPEFLKNRRWIRSLSVRDRFLYDRWKSWGVGARQRDIAYEIKFSDILDLFSEQEGCCYYTKVVLALEANLQTTISLDRIDSNLGYVKSNVVLCCTTINLMKLDLSVEDFKAWCGKVLYA